MAGTFDTSVLRQPRWILAMIVGAVLVLGFVRLGFWQITRFEERRDHNAGIEARISEPVRPLDGILGQYDDPEEMAYRHTTATGAFRVEGEFFAVGRTYDNLTGTLVATPFDLEGGSVLIVVRGLVPADTAGPPADGFAPATQPQTISGVLDDGEQPTAIPDGDPTDGVLTTLSRLDLAYIDTWVEGDVLPVLLVLEGWEIPNPEDTPLPIPRPELTDGSHLGYAVQWFAFALIVGFGVAALVWRAGTVPSTDGSEPDQGPVL